MKLAIVLTAMGCITLLECVALSNGIDGIILTAVIATLSGLAGLVLPTPKILKMEGKK